MSRLLQPPCLALLLLLLAGSASSLSKRFATVPLHDCRAPLYYNCHSSVDCIHGVYRCDGAQDCPDHDDEEGCLEFECPEGTLKCRDTGQCIGSHRVCDGCRDCPNGDDERNCTSQFLGCRGNQFHCAAGDTCIPVEWTCDAQHDHCADGADENCQYAEHKEIFLSARMPEYNVTVELNETAQIQVMRWEVVAEEGYVLYAKPLFVALGPVCGPSSLKIFEGEQEAAQLCGDSFPPWKRGHIATFDRIFSLYFKFFNDFGRDDDRTRKFSIKFWQSRQ